MCAAHRSTQPTRAEQTRRGQGGSGRAEGLCAGVTADAHACVLRSRVPHGAQVKHQPRASARQLLPVRGQPALGGVAGSRATRTPLRSDSEASGSGSSRSPPCGVDDQPSSVAYLRSVVVVAPNMLLQSPVPAPRPVAPVTGLDHHSFTGRQSCARELVDVPLRISKCEPPSRPSSRWVRASGSASR